MLVLQRGAQHEERRMTQTAGAMPPEAAFEKCLEITRSEAKNFYYGIRLLRPPKRRAMAALYALARRIDDIGDGDDTAEAKRTQLGVLRAKVRRLAGKRAGGQVSQAQKEAQREVSVQDGQANSSDLTTDPVLAGVAYAAEQFPIPVEAFEEIIEGCVQDSSDHAYHTIDDTVHYCRLVAGSVGRLSLGVFGCDNPELGPVLADDLGVALQLTNILRDIKEDAEMGRVYLPAEDIAKFDCAADLSGPRENVAELVLFEADRAEEWFERGFELLWHLDRRSRACVSAMSGIYFRLLRHIRKRPEAVMDGRMSVPAWEKSWVAARRLSRFRP